MEEAILRGIANLVARLDGPLHLRFLLQPSVAILLAIRAGLRDAGQERAPFLLALATEGQRRDRLRQAWTDVGKVFVVACLLDSAYQVHVHRSIYMLELLLTATLLALVPYALVRGPAARVGRAMRRRRTAHAA